MVTHRAVNALARAALSAMGVNPGRVPRHGDRSAACAFVARHALEELEELTLEDQRLLWETVRYLATYKQED